MSRKVVEGLTAHGADHPLVGGHPGLVAGHPLGGGDQGLQERVGFLALEDPVRALLLHLHRG
ncbi:hypothetical protein OHA17_01615 [Streptomyces sp. NBC_00212]